jgi:hypothetical protein
MVKIEQSSFANLHATAEIENGKDLCSGRNDGTIAMSIEEKRASCLAFYPSRSEDELDLEPPCHDLSSAGRIAGRRLCCEASMTRSIAPRVRIPGEDTPDTRQIAAHEAARYGSLVCYSRTSDGGPGLRSSAFVVNWLPASH